MRIGILSGAYPPQHDGIGDHTRHLAAQLAGMHSVVVFTSGRASDCVEEGIRVVRGFHPNRPASVRELEPGIAAAELDELLVQYNPFGFGPRGFNPWLPGLLRRLAGSPRPCRVSVLFHETYVPPENWKYLLMLSFQYPQFAAVCGAADRIFVAAWRWAAQVHALACGKEPVLLPVGSNLPRSALSRESAREALGIPVGSAVLGVFGSAHVSRLLDWIGAAVVAASEALPAPVLLYVGSDGAALRRFCAPGVRFMDCGRLEAGRAADCLVACDALLAPFIDGLSLRRGSVMAALRNGLPVVSTSTKWTDPVFWNQEAISLSPVEEGREAYARRAVAALREARANPGFGGSLREFYDNHFDWPVLARIFLSAPSPPPRVSAEAS